MLLLLWLTGLPLELVLGLLLLLLEAAGTSPLARCFSALPGSAACCLVLYAPGLTCPSAAVTAAAEMSSTVSLLVLKLRGAAVASPGAASALVGHAATRALGDSPWAALLIGLRDVTGLIG